MLKKWTKAVQSGGNGPKRVGAEPEEVPRDGEWYVMRSDSCPANSDPHDKKVTSLRIGAAARYLRRRAQEGHYPGFEVAKVRDNDAETGAITWHLLGRWS